MKIELEARETVDAEHILEVLLPDGIWYGVKPGTFRVFSPTGRRGSPTTGQSGASGAFFRFFHIDTNRWYEAPLGSIRAYNYEYEEAEDSDNLVIPVPE